MAKPKKTKLESYLDNINNEINERAIKLAKPITEETDIIKIDNDIKPLLLVISSDVLGEEHGKAVENAAIYKIVVLGIKAYNTGQIQFPQNIDINSLPGVLQNVASLLPSLTGCVGSLIECMGKNMKQQTNDTIFQYGLAAHIGASNSPKSPIMQELGISMGNLDNNINKEVSYQKFKELVKSLPNNKYRKRLIELAEKLYKEGRTEKPETNKQGQKKEDIYNTLRQQINETEETQSSLKKQEVKFNVDKD